MSELPRCGSRNRGTNHQCCMAEGHAGAHNVGGSYPKDQTERWVTPCLEGKCDFHPHTVGVYAGEEHCIHCGNSRPMRLLTEIEEAAFTQERVQAWKSIAAELRMERDRWIKEVEGLARLKKYLANVLAEARGCRDKGFIRTEARCLGAIECTLVVLGVLDAGQPIPYKHLPCRKWSWRRFRMVPAARQETYREFIYRLAGEVLCKKTSTEN